MVRSLANTHSQQLVLQAAAAQALSLGVGAFSEFKKFYTATLILYVA